MLLIAAPRQIICAGHHLDVPQRVHPAIQIAMIRLDLMLAAGCLLVEAVDLVCRADRDRGALVDSLEQAGRGGKERSGELLHTHNVVGHGSGAGTAFKVQGQVHVGGRGSVCPEGCRGCVSVSQSVLHTS